MAPQNIGKLDKGLKKRRVDSKITEISAKYHAAMGASSANPVQISDDDLKFIKRGTEAFAFK